MTSIEIRETVLDPQYPDLANSYHNMAGIFQNLGETEEAIRYFEKAQAIEATRAQKD